MRRALGALAAAAGVAVLTGCAPTVVLSPAPQATTTACAGVIVRISSQTLGTAAPRNTTAQGTAAWGSPLAVTLYCGVALRPSADPCYTYDEVDWKLAERRIGSTDYEVLTTVGRSPVVQVEVDPDLASVNDVLPPISDAVKAAVPRTGAGCTEASAPSASPGATP